MIETAFVVLALKKRAYLRVIISRVQFSFPLLSLCQVFVPWLIACAIHITVHFMAHEAQILIFWRMCSIFFVIKKRARFLFFDLEFLLRSRAGTLAVSVSTKHICWLSVCKILVQSITNKIIFYCFIFEKRCFETTFFAMAYYSKIMLPYFPFIVKYFNRVNSGVMPDYFCHDMNKIEVTLMSF